MSKAKTKTKKTVASPEKEEKKTKKEEYIEQRQEKLAAAREALVSGIKSLETDEDWKKFLNRLTKRSRFSPGRLSFGNQILVYLQFPEATNVATYRSWYRIGRWPIKGSHGIMIFQPRPYMRKTKEEKSDNGDNGNGKEYKPTGRMFFKPIYLFDISQTEGKDPPEWLKPPPPPKIDNKEVFKNSVEKLAELIQGLPESPVSKIEIRERKKGERPEVHGWYERDSKIIVVYKIDNRGQMFKTLVHEIAHAMMHAENGRSTEVKEVEAESVAYVVNKAIGLDTSDYSFKYVANWSGMKEKADEAIKIIERSGQRIVSTSNMILDVLMPLAELPDEDEKTGSPDTPQPVEEPTRRSKGRPKGSKNIPKIIVGFDKSMNYLFKVPKPTHLNNYNTVKNALENPPILDNIPNQEITKQSSVVVERLKYIKPGENAWNANIPEHLKLNVKGAKLSQIYRRLDPYKPSYTITGSGGGGTHGYHWIENRALTNRERARIQTFPDNFVFEGSKESVRKQIGMAVPPKLSEIIFTSILKTIAGIDYEYILPNWNHINGKEMAESTGSEL